MSDVNTKAGRIDAENQKVATVPRQKPQLLSGNAGHAIVPQSVEAAFRMADLIVKAGMAPKSFKTAEAVCVAILQGLEVGLTPMAALQSIAVVNGMPTLWGDGFLALIENSGLLEEMDEEILFDNGEPIGATCTMKRRDRKPVTRMFTKPMAARAGLLGKDGPWKQYPQRMYQMRARSWCGRDVFPDVLRGLGSAEERQDMVDITDQGGATTAPAEPRRSDFKPIQGDDTPTNAEPEAETWELFDEVGEMVGEFNAFDWVSRLELAAEKLEGKPRAQLLENNIDTAKLVAKELKDHAIDADLAALYTPPAADPVDEKSAPDYWHLGDAVIGEANIIATIKEMIDGDAVTEPKDVENILAQNQDRIRKMSPMKRQGIESHAEARHAALQKAAT